MVCLSLKSVAILLLAGPDRLELDIHVGRTLVSLAVVQTEETAARSETLLAFYGFQPLNRRALETTDTEESAIAPEAIIGDNVHPVNGYSSPAASGIPSVL